MHRPFLWRLAAWAIGGVCALLLAYLALRTPEPARSALELVSLACEAAPAEERIQQIAPRLSESLELSTSDPVLSEVQGVLSREQAVGLLRAFLLQRPACNASLDDWRLRDGPRGLRWVEGMLRYSDSQPGDLHAERRAFRAAFREREGGQQLERLFLGAAEPYEPEARP
jgi:hypothetical protein